MSELIRQPSFAGGEIQPFLYGRTDWSKYGISVRTMRNFFVNPVGPAMNRAGTRWIKKLGNVLGKNWKIIPFTITNDVAFTIIASDTSMILYDQNGVQVQVIAGIPYLDVDIPKLRFHQLGNTIFIAHSGYPPAQISQIAGVWTYSLVTYTGDGFVSLIGMSWNAAWAANNAPIGIPAAGGPLIRAFVPLANYLVGDYVLYAAAAPIVSIWLVLMDYATGGGPVPDPATLPKNFVLAIDGSHPTKNLGWATTIEWEDVFGNIRESSPIWTTGVNQIGVYTDRPAKIIPGTLTAARPTNFARILGYKFYKGLPGAYGFIGRSEDGAFSDNGIAPDFSVNPPENTDPTVFYDAAGNPIHSYPTVVSFFEQRFVEAGFPLQPHGVSFSEIGNLFRFDTPKLTRDDAAFDTGLLSETINDIRSVLPSPGRALVFFCGSSEWSLRGAQAYPIGPSSLDPKRGSGNGSSWVQPILVGDTILFNTALGQGVRDLEYNSERDNMVGQDLSIFVRHFFERYTILDWAYADIPYKLVWMVRSDGNLLGLTYSKDQEVIAWHQHNSPGGVFKAVATLPDGKEHSVYFVTERFGSVQFEKMSSRLITDVRYGNFLDASVQFDGHILDGTILNLNNGGADVAAGSDVTISRVSGSHPFAAGDEETTIVVFPDSASPYIFTILEVIDADNVTCTAEQEIKVPWTLGLDAIGNWARGKVKFAMDALYEGQELSVLSDASYLGEYVVQGGFLVLDTPSVVVQAGIRYNCDLELLSVAHPTEETSPMQKTVLKVWVELSASRSLKAGPDLTRLKTWPQRKPKDPKVLPVFSGKIPLTSQTGWDPDGQISFRQDAPLPVTILAVTREAEFGGT